MFAAVGWNKRMISIINFQSNHLLPKILKNFNDWTICFKFRFQDRSCQSLRCSWHMFLTAPGPKILTYSSATDHNNFPIADIWSSVAITVRIRCARIAVTNVWLSHHNSLTLGLLEQAAAVTQQYSERLIPERLWVQILSGAGLFLFSVLSIVYP